MVTCYPISFLLESLDKIKVSDDIEFGLLKTKPMVVQEMVILR